MPYKKYEDYKKNKVQHYIDNVDTYKWRARERLTGVSREQFFALLEKQDNKCALCNKPFEDLSRKCHIDHCHESDKIRGLLCMTCNVGLGMLGDNVEGLEKAVRYLKGELN